MIITNSKVGKCSIPPISSPPVLCNHLTASLAFYRLSITSVHVSLRMAWPTSHCECGFNPAEWTETRLWLQRRSKWMVSCFLFLNHKMRGGGYLLAHQVGPGLHDLPLVPGDPESGEEEGLSEDLCLIVFVLQLTSHMTGKSHCLLEGQCLKLPFSCLVMFLAITSV